MLTAHGWRRCRLTRLLAIVTTAVACLSCGVNAPQTPTTEALPRGMYVRDVAALIAQPAARERLAELVTAGLVTEVIPYGAGPMLATAEGRTTLSGWIDELHRRGADVNLPIAGEDRLVALDQLLREHPVVWIDGLVTEDEYWNRGDRAAGLDQLLALLASMRSHAAGWNHPGPATRIGAYLGYPTAAEAARLAPALDFVYLDYSVGSPERAWRHVHGSGGPLRDRFAWFASAGVEAWPIFYAAGEVDMAPSLRANGTSAAEARFRADLAADPEYSQLSVTGFVYFTIEAMPDPD